MLRSSNLIRKSAEYTGKRIIQNNKHNNIYSPTATASLWNQQHRTFFSSLQGLANAKDKDVMISDERKTVEYIRSLKPGEAIQQIERGWKSGTFPASEAVVKEYLKSAASLNKLDSLNVISLLQLIQKGQGNFNGVAGVPLGNVMGADSAMHQSTGNVGVTPEALFAAMQSMNSNNLNSGAGSTAKDPLYIKTTDVTVAGTVGNVVFKLGFAFMIIAFMGSMLMSDEKGGGGAAAAISSRMGFASTVKQAEESDKCFADVVGVDEAKAELEEIVMYLRDSERFTRLGGKLPKGILLTGPPGTGKTLLARAVAGEAKVPFFYTSGSEFEEMYVGVGAKRVRELFEAAKQKTPCIIFIDEIDAIGGSRNVKDQSALKMTLNQLLVEMDGFEQNKGIIVIAATNFVKSLDSALVRPGRFDKVVDVNMPDVAGRKAILELYSKNIELNRDVDLGQLAKGTPGFTGADLQNLINQAAVKASVEGLKSIGMQALEYAKDKILMGAERRSAVLSPETIKMTAFHEAGHALVALKTDGADPIHKATVMPRGSSLGMVMQLQDSDQTSQSRKQMLAMLDICMGGRVAEEIVYGAENVTSGASSDIQQATRIAKMMVTKWGMSDKVGLFYVDEKEKQSGEFQGIIDTEIRLLLTDSYSRSKKCLETHRKELDVIANGLIEFETLSGGEIVDLLSGVKPNMKGLRSQRPSRSNEPLPPLLPVALAKDVTPPVSRGVLGYFTGEPVASKAISPAPVVQSSPPPATGKKTLSLFGSVSGSSSPPLEHDVTSPPVSTVVVSTLQSKIMEKNEKKIEKKVESKMENKMEKIVVEKEKEITNNKNEIKSEKPVGESLQSSNTTRGPPKQ